MIVETINFTGKKNQLSLTDLLNSIATQGGVEGIEVKTENNPIGTVEVGSLYALHSTYTLNNTL